MGFAKVQHTTKNRMPKGGLIQYPVVDEPLLNQPIFTN